MKFRRSKTPLTSVDPPRPRTEGPTEGELARVRAEENLDLERVRTEEVQSRTAEYAAQSGRLRMLRQDNGLRKLFQDTLAKGA